MNIGINDIVIWFVISINKECSISIVIREYTSELSQKNLCNTMAEGFRFMYLAFWFS